MLHANSYKFNDQYVWRNECCMLTAINLMINMFGGMNVAGCICLPGVYCCIVREYRRTRRERRAWNTQPETSSCRSNSKKNSL